MKLIQEFYLDAVSEEERQELANQAWSFIREQRDALISATDWTQMPDATLTQDKKSEFVLYRKALRDIPQTFDNPNEVVWPSKPTA